MFYYYAPVIFTVIGCISQIVFILRIKHEPIRSRAPYLVIPSTIFSAISLFLYSWYWEAADAGNTQMQQTGELTPEIQKELIVACRWFQWNAGIFLPLWLTPHFLRAIKLALHFKWNSLKLQREYNTKFNFHFFTSNIFNFIVLGVFILIDAGISCGVLFSNDFGALTPEAVMASQHTCYHNVEYLILVQGILAIITFGTFGYFLWGLDDPYKIKQEFVLYTFGIAPIVIIHVVLTYLSVSPAAQYAIFVIGVVYALIVTVWFPIALSFKKEYRLDFFVSPDSEKGSIGSQSHRMKKSQFSASLSSNNSEGLPEPQGSKRMKHIGSDSELERVIRDPELFADFLSFSSSLWCAENILFYEVVKQYEELIQQNPIQAKDLAIKIKNEFIVNGSLRQINVEETNRREILQKIAQEEFTPNLFLEVKEQVYKLIQYDTLPKWKQSMDGIPQRLKKFPSEPNVNGNLLRYHEELTLAKQHSFEIE